MKTLDHVSTEPVYDQVLVVNHSRGFFDFRDCDADSPALRNAFQNAFLMDIALVCAAGNTPTCVPDDSCSTSDTCIAYPAAYEDYSLAVSALWCDGGRWEDHAVGSYIDLTAPGKDIPTTEATGPTQYASFDHTSSPLPMPPPLSLSSWGAIRPS